MTAPDKAVEVGLVLQGGGALGAYELGAVIALLELMDAISKAGRTVKLVAVTGVSIGAFNAACIVGAKDRADARRRLRALWADLTLETPAGWWPAASSNLSLFGLPGFYAPRRDVWNALNWTSYYDTDPMLGTLANHIDFAALNASETVFVVTAVDVATGTLRRFGNQPDAEGKQTPVTPRQVLASGSLPPQFPATPVGGQSYWDGGIVDNTPLGDAIAAFSPDGAAERFLVVMNLFRKERPLPKNMIEVNDRLAELRYGNRLRQDKSHAETINALVATVERLAALVPDDKLDKELRDCVASAQRFKVLEEITDIDLADPDLMAQAGLATASEQSGGFRDFSAAAIQRRHDVGYKLAQLKLHNLFAEHGLLRRNGAESHGAA
jgi:predicted acylesterase/phospholipase RssA